MKVLVIQTFRDKNTELLHSKGETIEITKERFEEIALSGIFVEETKETKKKVK